MKFAPTGDVDGFLEAQLLFPDANLDDPLEIPLEGRGKQAEFSVTPASKSFGDAKIGTGITRTSQTFVVARTGQIAVPFNGASLTGANADSFSITSNDCPPKILDPDVPCEIKVVFDPKSGAAGARSANLLVNAFSSATPGVPKTIPLTGTATVDPPVPTCLTDPNLCPPAGKPALSLKLKSPGKVKRGKTLVVTATVKNTGGDREVDPAEDHRPRQAGQEAGDREGFEPRRRQDRDPKDQGQGQEERQEGQETQGEGRRLRHRRLEQIRVADSENQITLREVRCRLDPRSSKF